MKRNDTMKKVSEQFGGKKLRYAPTPSALVRNLGRLGISPLQKAIIDALLTENAASGSMSLTHWQIADWIGVNSDTIKRLLHDLKKMGVLTIKSRAKARQLNDPNIYDLSPLFERLAEIEQTGEVRPFAEAREGTKRKPSKLYQQLKAGVSAEREEDPPEEEIEAAGSFQRSVSPPRSKEDPFTNALVRRVLEEAEHECSERGIAYSPLEVPKAQVLAIVEKHLEKGLTPTEIGFLGGSALAKLCSQKAYEVAPPEEQLAQQIRHDLAKSF